MKRYIIFIFEINRPSGGSSDLEGFADTEEEARSFAKEFVEDNGKHALEIYKVQIYDTVEGETISYTI